MNEYVKKLLPIKLHLKDWESKMHLKEVPKTEFEEKFEL